MVRILCPGFGSTGTGSTVGASIRRRKLRPGEGTHSTQAPRLFCLDGTMARADLQVGLEDPNPLSGRRVDGQGFDGGWPTAGTVSSRWLGLQTSAQRDARQTVCRPGPFPNQVAVRGPEPLNVFSRQNLPLIAPLWRGDRWVPGLGHGHRVLARG